MMLQGKRHLIATVDLNGKQIDGATDEVLPMGSLENKFKAFGWEVLTIENGNDFTAIKSSLLEAKERTGKGKPICVLMKTEMGNGVDFMMHTHAWHGKAPNDEQLESALAQTPKLLGITNQKPIVKMIDYINQGSQDTRSGFGAGLTELREPIQT